MQRGGEGKARRGGRGEGGGVRREGESTEKREEEGNFVAKEGRVLPGGEGATRRGGQGEEGSPRVLGHHRRRREARPSLLSSVIINHRVDYEI